MPGSGGASTVRGVMSLSDITVRVALLTALALVAVVAVGWRQPARRRVVSPRDPSLGPTGDPNREATSTEPTPPVVDLARRRILDLVALGGIAVGVAFVVSIALAFVVSWFVTNVIEGL